jgi:hypothetical protein
MSKGSAPRPFEVDHETYSNNFDAIFGKKTPPPQPIEPKKEEENERPV